MARYYNLSLVLFLFCLTILCTWALKNLSKNVTCSISGLTFVLVHSILGFLGYVHPDDGNKLRKISHYSNFIAGVLIPPLITADMFMIVDQHSSWIFILFPIAVFPLLAKYQCSYMLGKYISDFAVALNTVLLIYIRLSLHAAYWIEGLIILILLNHFGLSRLPQRFDISCIELDTISLFFITLFSVKSLNEIVDNH